eukprot:Partr_v1_DN27391_c3_g1_i1_m46246 putative Calcium-binding peroxygenase involved in the degradation of storage lipid in oil bodies. May be involved in the interaction between oil bodies and vacuoles during seed germination and in the oxylipin signaling pathways and plant defense responses. Can catalyze sulfoxidation of thiobenzamide, hydroxylation of aniline
MAKENLQENFSSEINSVPITHQRKVAKNLDNVMPHAGMARANIAPDLFNPEGTVHHPQKMAEKRSVLQQHVDYFDINHDGIITPLETFRGFRRLGFNLFMSVWAIFVIHPAFSWMTCPWPWYYAPFGDPLFRIWTQNIHKAKHGSDSGTYDNEGRYIPQKFEEIFSKWAHQEAHTGSTGYEKMTLGDLWRMTQDLWVTNDFFGWFAAKFEWIVFWMLCKDEQGMVTREQIRSCFDGSLFYKMEHIQHEKLNRKSK